MPSPDLVAIAPDVTMVDTAMAGARELNAVYLIAAREPCLVEAAPEADGAVVHGALSRLGVGPRDLAHVVVTHIHIDHAGGAGALLERFPRATVWVHQRGAAHLVDPTRLLASTARTYGAERMAALYGGMTPCPEDRTRSVDDGDVIDLGDRTLRVVATPGHASHHVALADTSSGDVYAGEAIGTYLPWAQAFRPALPPPEVDVEQALTSIDRIAALGPARLLTSHFGPTPDPEDALAAARATIGRWSGDVGARLAADPGADDDDLRTLLISTARAELAEVGVDLDAVLDRYDVLGSIRMNAQGLGRYWRKRAGETRQET